MQGLRNHSQTITSLVRKVHNQAHEASGIVEALGGQFSDGDAENFMAVFEDLPITDKHAFIEWLHRTMEGPQQ